MTTNIYLTRHGETELNMKKVYFGWTDVPLTLQGEAQCRVVAESLNGIAFDSIITSPLIRTMQSSEIITGLNKNNFEIYPELKELNFGKWENLHYKEIEKIYNNEWLEWAKDWQGFCIPEGESFNTFYDRVKLCFNEIAEKYKGKTILIVGHQGVLKIIATLILNLKAEEFWTLTFKFGTCKLYQIDKCGKGMLCLPPT
ncbi:alpha-ribazole phosphatase [Clostridium sp.]|jgi:alpha-ribazole phosphatase|uniref:alpha-ribazole phosphatase n=1 Tax=Clostridium sp. TaxID=1506 RepID=UPI003EEFBCBA